MPLSEFDLIEKYFRHAFRDGPEVKCGIGDDAAIVTVPSGMDLALAMDTLVAGIHFPDATRPEDIGYKALAVNLSDMAAMGAEPRWVTLSLTLPGNDEAWLQAFMSGFGLLMNDYSLSLIGGDLGHGPLSITIQLHGYLPQGKALYRHGAQAGDLIYVSGTLGDAGLALAVLNKQRTVDENYHDYLMERLNRPEPRVKPGMALRDIASSAIDISDGLLSDLEHILVASHKGAEIHIDKLPLSAALHQLPEDESVEFALTSGDDYELCFTLPRGKKSIVETELEKILPLTCIGQITGAPGIQWLRPDGSEFRPSKKAYTHF